MIWLIVSWNCRYGVGQPTERAYFYKQDGFEHNEVQSGDMPEAQCVEGENCDITPRTPLDLPLSRKVWIDNTVSISSNRYRFPICC